MALRVRFQGPIGASYAYAIERLSDGSIYDFSTSTFTTGAVTTLTAALPENTPNFPGQYKATLTSTPTSQFSNGDYLVTVLDEAAQRSVGELVAAMYNGDDATQFPGGPVASVTAPVTVGTNNDKSNYALAAAGLDQIVVESGVNARQALSPILAASAGVVTGAGTGTIVIRGANAATPRITATTDNAGNRSAVTLTLPT